LVVKLVSILFLKIIKNQFNCKGQRKIVNKNLNLLKTTLIKFKRCEKDKIDNEVFSTIKL